MQYLKDIKLPELSGPMSKELDKPIKECEIKETISKLKKKYSPDGYINEFYKTFKDLLSPLLLKAYHQALTSGIMAPSWNYASIIVIYKEGKDPTECQSYRPISLLSGDLKILTTILARRQQDQLPYYTSRSNWIYQRKILNYLKAFDHVSWQFLIQTLKKFKFGPNFLKWIQTLYSNPQASVKLNGYRSKAFILRRECRQGCALSPYSQSA